MAKNFKFTVDPTDQGARLDKFLSEKMPECSRAEIQKMIERKNILVAGKEAKPSYKLKTGDSIEVAPPAGKTELTPDPSIKFEVIHDEKDFAVINKPAGIVVYPGTKHEGKTLTSGLLAKWPEIKNVGEDQLRPGIVHRLDKDTSGLMIIAKNSNAFDYFKNLFKNREVEKTYIALVYGHVEPKKGAIDFPIRRSKTNPVKQVAVKDKKQDLKAREASTNYEVVKYLIDSSGDCFTLVKVKPETGRMHQIRVHFSSIGYNIVGDKLYSSKKNKTIFEADRQFLHAQSIKFITPSGKKVEFASALPEDMEKFLKTLKIA